MYLPSKPLSVVDEGVLRVIKQEPNANGDNAPGYRSFVVLKGLKQKILYLLSFAVYILKTSSGQRGSRSSSVETQE